MKSKVPVNLENYPALMELANTNKTEFLQLMKAMFTIANENVQHNNHEVSKNMFGLEFSDLVKNLVDGIFDYRGMMEHLPNKTNAATLASMNGHYLNPLASAFGGFNLRDSSGNEVSFEEKFGIGKEDFSVKRWLQGLMFYSYYCSLPDFAKYLATNDYTLLEEEKYANIGKLIEIRPALDYQKKVGILPGKLVPETGFFDCGEIEKDETNCKVCMANDSLIQVTDDLTVCVECKGGFTHG